MEKFPDFDEDVRWLFLVDYNFQELCSDYILCAEKVMLLKAEMEECSAKMEEYAQIKDDLEKEILKKLWQKKGNMMD